MKLSRLLIALAVVGLAGSSALAGDSCTEHEHNYNNGKKQSSSVERREFTLASTGRIEVDGRKNGGIQVTGEDRSDVFVEACVRAWAETKAGADNIVQTTRIETSGVIRGVSDVDDYKTSVSFKLRVPRNTDLNLMAQNGGLSVDGVNGTMELRTVNGGLKLANVAGSIKGRTTNGGVKVGLGGNGWTGDGLDVETINGGVKIYIPSSFAANVEVATVNGGFKSDFPELQLPKKEGKYGDWSRNKRVSAAINGGGATIRAVTTNGGVKINASDRAQ